MVCANRNSMTITAPKFKRQFNLLRRFAIASLAVIAAIAVVNGILLSNFLTQRLLDREASITMEFVQNVLQGDGSVGYLAEPGNKQLEQLFLGSMVHFTSMRDVSRINVYARDHTVLWSSDKRIMGQRFEANDELDMALEGRPVFEGGSITPDQRGKPEHVGLSAQSAYFIETYVPIRSASGRDVVGVFEIYKAPVALSAAIMDGHRQIWITAFLGALALYLTLYWIVRSADREIRNQHTRLTKAETMAAVGELASSVAHNIRNPLASIRSSAEVAMELGASPSTEQAQDIMASVDRIEGWLREMVSFVHVDSALSTRIDAARLLEDCFAASAPAFERAGIQARVDGQVQGATIRADRALLGHVIHSLIANAIEATAPGGRVTGQVTRLESKVLLRIADNGSGIAPDHLRRLFGLFFTTKPRGLGIGLALAHRAIERIGGAIRVDSTVGAGTAFTLELPAA